MSTWPSARRKGARRSPNLANLDVYHEIGLEFELEAINALSRDAYFAGLSRGARGRRPHYPIAPDSRLWRRDPPGAALARDGVRLSVRRGGTRTRR